MNNNASLGAYGVMYVVQNKKSEVVNLLLKNGVFVPMNASNMQLALLVTDLLKVSKSFYRDFSLLLLNQDVVNGMSVNMSGSYANAIGDGEFDFSIFNGGTQTTTAPKDATSVKSSPIWLNTGLGLLQTGFQGYLKLDDNKTKRELADASVKISNDVITKETLTPTPKGLSTGAIVGISLLGVTVVGLVIYLITKNKNQ
jgi:hypothetical protein